MTPSWVFYPADRTVTIPVGILDEVWFNSEELLVRKPPTVWDRPLQDDTLSISPQASSLVRCLAIDGTSSP